MNFLALSCSYFRSRGIIEEVATEEAGVVTRDIGHWCFAFDAMAVYLPKFVSYAHTCGRLFELCNPIVIGAGVGVMEFGSLNIETRITLMQNCAFPFQA